MKAASTKLVHFPSVIGGVATISSRSSGAIFLVDCILFLVWSKCPLTVATVGRQKYLRTVLTVKPGLDMK